MDVQSPETSTKFEKAIAYLERRINYENFRSLPYLELLGRLGRLRELLVKLGSPEKRFLTVHVAGTKGKGSTCTMLKSILRQTGYRVGLFSSPHLYSPLERIAIDGVSCDAEEFGDLMLSLRDRIGKWEKNWSFTYFELTTLFAFEYFARKKVDVAILEVGLGGRLDATNVCLPTVTILTNISFDHVEQLGPTLEAIAGEKAGIIKSGIPVVAGLESEAAQRVIQREAEAVGAPCFFLGEHFSFVPEGSKMKFRFVPRAVPETPFREIGSLTLKLPGEHQRANATLAIAAAQLLRDRLKISVPAIRSGLAKAFLPIRVERFRPSTSSPTLVIDGAHNQASVGALVRTLKYLRPFRRKSLVFGTSLDKDIEGMFAELLPFFDRIILTQHSSNPRRFPPQNMLTTLCSLANAQPVSEIAVEENSFRAFVTCWNSAKRNDLVCVCGSMYLAGELRQFFIESNAVRVPVDGESADTPRC